MGDADGRPASKVARLIEGDGLAGVGDELAARWTGDGVDRLSLRDCATLFNKRLLDARLRAAGGNALAAEVDGTYERLTGDDVTTGVRTETRNRLRQRGVDVDRLERDFVSYQAVRSYLTEYHDAEYDGPSDTEKIEKDAESIQRLLTRTHTVTEERIEALRDTGRIDVGTFEVLVDAQVLCQSCGSQYAVSEFLAQSGCGCQR